MFLKLFFCILSFTQISVICVRSEMVVPKVQYVGTGAKNLSKNLSSENTTKNIDTTNLLANLTKEIVHNKSSASTEFSTPNAIRVIPDGQVQLLYNNNDMSSSKSLNQMEDVEETFTYQVKRQNKNKFLSDAKMLIKSDWENFFNANIKGNNLVITPDKKIDDGTNNKKVDELERGMENVTFELIRLLELISGIERKNNEINTATNSALSNFIHKLTHLNESIQINSNVTQEIHTNLTIDKNRVEGQMQTLTMHLRNLRDTSTDHIRNSSAIFNELTSKVKNATHDIQMNEIRTRFNQKSLTTLDRLFNANIEKINEIGLQVGPLWAEQTVGCGGVLIGEAGIISYKFRQPYLNNEICIWTIRANRRSRVLLQLLEDGFQNASNSDFLTITEFTDEPHPSLVTSSRIEHGNRASHTFRGPLIFISFYSDSEIAGNGFTLKFQGAGNYSAPDTLNAARFQHFHLKESVGRINYPDDGKNVLYQPNEITTFVLNPITSIDIKVLKVHLQYTDLEKEESCEFDAVNFYASVMASFALTNKYCDQEHEFSGETLQSSDGTFIVLFRSDASTQFKGFQFSWETIL